MPASLFKFGLLVVAAGTALSACDSTNAEIDEAPIVAAMEEIPLEEQVIGLWERDFGNTTIGWLGKEGGGYQAGEARPIFPVVGRWSLKGDTLELFDTRCVDRGFYRIEIEELDLIASIVDDTCGGREETLVGTWRRFVYGQ